MRTSYLKPTVIVEPLVLQWPAWIHLISPLTAGHHFKHRYLGMLKSFIEHPDQHQQATDETALTGGFFVNLNQAYHAEAEQLLAAMETKLASLMTLADEIQRLCQQLMLIAKGQSLEPFYPMISEPLQGAVELLYDLNNQLSVRFIEPILYERFYESLHQSLMLSCPDSSDNRPFSLSTPRFKKPGDIQLDISFDSELIDQLAIAKEKSIDVNVLMQRLNLGEADQKHFLNLFTNEQPHSTCQRNYTGEGVRIRYFGHACVLLQTATTSILMDPLIGSFDSAHRDRFGYLDLPEVIDCVLISHSHQDHIALETLLQIRHKVKQFIVPRNNGGQLQDPSMQVMLQRTGFKHVYTIDEFERRQVGDITITGIPFLGEHGDLNILSKIAYHVTAQDKTCLFAVDSNNVSPGLYDTIRAMLGPIDVVFIGMECQGAPYSWAYGPLSAQKIEQSHDQERRLSGSNAEKAWALVQSLGAKKAYVYAMGLEPWLSHILGLHADEASLPITESNQFIKQCNAQGIACERLYLRHESIIACVKTTEDSLI